MKRKIAVKVEKKRKQEKAKKPKYGQHSSSQWP